jgi:hypothetical protein
MTTVTAEPVYWSSTQKIAFRFCMLFFVLFIFFNPNGAVPFYDGIYELYIDVFHQLIPWIGKHIMHLAKPITEFTGGSGDTTYDWVTVLFFTALTIVVTIIWTITDRKTRNYNKLLYWLTVIVRYYVAFTMVSYGSVKVIKLQFPAPNFVRLLEPVGSMSPMGLAWTYLGYSTGFNYFAGFAELFCGLLLFFRRTTTLGAIIGLVVAGNIMAINYCFDVPVKLLSTFLVLMCTFLLVKDARRLINFFFKNKEALPANLSPHRFKTRWKNIILDVAKYALLLWVLSWAMIDAVRSSYVYGANAQKPPLYGLYNVETFVFKKDTLQPLTTDTIRWGKFMISNKGRAAIKMMNDSTRRYNFKPDTTQHIIAAFTNADTVHKFYLKYTLQKPDIMILKGMWKKDSIYVRLRKMDPNNFPLLQRGFHLINEYPNNR